LKVEYPKIEQAVYVARKRAWFNAVGSAYMRLRIIISTFTYNKNRVGKFANLD
jgi:hypothetical protein